MLMRLTVFADSTDGKGYIGGEFSTKMCLESDLKYSIAVLSFLLICLGCSSDSGGSTMTTPGGGQGGAAGGQGGSGGEGGGPPPAMQGGGSLPTDVADCERGCLCKTGDLEECFSDVAGRLVSLCTQACQSGDRGAFVNLVGASCSTTSGSKLTRDHC